MAKPETTKLVMVDGRVLYGDKALTGAGPKDPGCESIEICGVEKFLCIAEASTKDKLDQTFAQVQSTLETALTSYDGKVQPGGGPLSPLAPLTRCAAPVAAN